VINLSPTQVTSVDDKDRDDRGDVPAIVP
jgi:hypothetical protein